MLFDILEFHMCVRVFKNLIVSAEILYRTIL